MQSSLNETVLFGVIPRSILFSVFRRGKPACMPGSDGQGNPNFNLDMV